MDELIKKIDELQNLAQNLGFSIDVRQHVSKSTVIYEATFHKPFLDGELPTRALEAV